MINSIDNDIINFETVPETQVNDYDEQFFNEDEDIEIPETQLPQDYDYVFNILLFSFHFYNIFFLI